jgi:hypothetical protein
MRRSALVRALTLALAFVHTFPARKHLATFAVDPSWAEGWKGLGAAVAVAIYLLPIGVQSRGLAFVWRERRVLLRIAGIALALVHVVPALDHVPAFFGAPTWGDAWRGFGSTLAAAWFLAPLPVQGRVISLLSWVTRPTVARPSLRPMLHLPPLRPLQSTARDP